MKKLLSYILTPFHLVTFGLLLVIFHPIQWLCLTIGGYKWHKVSVDYLNLCLTKSLWLLGSSCYFENEQKLPINRPIIVVANHNSLYDIPPLIWYLRKHHVKFVSKIELGSGIPSVSFNLRHGGSVLIDRANQRQSLMAIRDFAGYIEKNKYTAVIFPEGTRGKKGQLGRFSTSGFKMLLKYIPSAIIIPISIENTWRLHKYGKYPMSISENLRWKVHPPIDPTGREPEELLHNIAEIIRISITNK